jgi:hypothetical protein
MTIPFRIPSEFSDPALYERVGSLIKSRASGKIVAHLQEAGGWELLKHVPVPGGNILGLAADVVQSVQLVKIQQTLNTVQTLATVGAIASVASIGVTVAGFALVMGKLKRMDGKLDRVLSGTAEIRTLVEGANVKLDALPLARLNAELEGVGIATRYDPDRRKESLQRSIAELRALRHYYGVLLANEKFCGLGTESLPAILETHERLTAACEAELFAEFLLGSEPAVLEESWSRQKRLFDSIAWRTPAELFELSRQGDRARGMDLIVSPDERSAKVKALTEVRVESMRRLETQPLLASTVQRLGFSPYEYLTEVEKRGAEGEPLLALAVS